MRTVKPKEYQVFYFEELPEKSQEKALQEYWSINIDFDWWDCTYSDAKEVGLEIEAFDLDRASYCDLKFLWSPQETAKSILKNHGSTCETYKTAKEFIDSCEALTKSLEDSEELEDLEEFEELQEDFRKSLSEDYRIILQNEYEYLTSEEAIKETLVVNEYEFTLEGKID